MIAYEYANALFELATKENKHEIVRDEYSLFLKLIKDNPDFLKVLTFPNIVKDEKKECIKKTLIGFDELILNFFYVLIDNNRMDMVEEIGQEFAKMERAFNNVTKVDVYTAVKLTSDELKEVESKLSNIITDTKILINNIEDPSLIGGMKAVYDGKEIDFSLNKKLNDLKKNL